MGDVLKKVPVREQDAKVRATNFEEVCLGYNKEEAVEEANRCLTCKNAKCVQGCPVNIDIPGFVKEVKEGNFEEAYKVIGKSSSLPAVCGRVKENVSVESKVKQFPSVNWNVLLLTGQKKMASNQKQQK